MHSVRLEPTKLILLGTRTTDQATGDAIQLLNIYTRYVAVLTNNNRIINNSRT